MEYDPLRSGAKFYPFFFFLLIQKDGNIDFLSDSSRSGDRTSVSDWSSNLVLMCVI